MGLNEIHPRSRLLMKRLAAKRHERRVRQARRRMYVHMAGCVVCHGPVRRDTIACYGGSEVVEGEIHQGPLGMWWRATWGESDTPDWLPATCPGYEPSAITDKVPLTHE